ncbi:hypothetical protein CR513_05786, partial [Mucuna pruriens]
MANPSQNDWSQLLEDTLWAHKIAYQTLSSSIKPTTCWLKSNIELIGKSRSATWPMTKSTMKENFICKNWELRLEAYENSQNKKKVLLFHSRLKLITGKLHSRWDGPFVITIVFPYGVIELRDEANNQNFRVNGHQIKPYHEGLTSMVGEVGSILLMEPTLPKETPSEDFPIPLPHYKPKSRKSMINLNLRGQRSFGIVLGVGSHKCEGDTPRHY